MRVCVVVVVDLLCCVLESLVLSLFFSWRDEGEGETEDRCVVLEEEEEEATPVDTADDRAFDLPTEVTVVAETTLDRLLLLEALETELMEAADKLEVSLVIIVVVVDRGEDGKEADEPLGDRKRVGVEGPACLGGREEAVADDDDDDEDGTRGEAEEEEVGVFLIEALAFREDDVEDDDEDVDGVESFLVIVRRTLDPRTNGDAFCCLVVVVSVLSSSSSSRSSCSASLRA